MCVAGGACGESVYGLYGLYVCGMCVVGVQVQRREERACLVCS